MQPECFYTELNLGKFGRQNLLRNILRAQGYMPAAQQDFEGLSGIRHVFEVVGVKGKNLLLVVGGAEGDKASRSPRYATPRNRMVRWRNKALLSAYDVESVLAAEGWMVELMFFQNVSNIYPRELDELDPDEVPKFFRQSGLECDHRFEMRASSEPIPVERSEELVKVASSVGACFFTLNDLTLDELVYLAAKTPDETDPHRVQAISDRIRVSQYFRPPTDELIIAASDFSARRDREFVHQVYRAALTLGHEPAQNALVPNVDFRDPVATAVELEKHKYIHFETTLEVTEEGRKVTQVIRKTAQGSFIVRVLRNIGLPELAKAIIAAFKGAGG
ncbi:MAG: hypothetical protein HQ580_20185 [Planctomycetes bacterium]|nr:hypothetical protein [Planctomycetota bacterium]